MHPSKTVIFSMVVLGISLINAEKTVAIVPHVSIVPVVPITALDNGGQPFDTSNGRIQKRLRPRDGAGT